MAGRYCAIFRCIGERKEKGQESRKVEKLVVRLDSEKGGSGLPKKMKTEKAIEDGSTWVE